MDSSVFAAKKSTKPPRVARDEHFNREGRWTRRFYVRSELWPIVEHWASENDYRMTAAKGQSRRLYQKGWNPGFFVSFVDIKLIENDAVITSWIEVGLKVRLLMLLTLPRELPVKPKGLKGATHRRALCRELNVLLERLRQPLIANSRGFHIADLDLSSRILGVTLAILTTVFLVMGITRLEVRPGLSASLLILFAKNFGYLIALGIVLLGIQQFAMLRLLEERLYRFISAGIILVGHAALAVLLFTHTANDLLMQRIGFHCLLNFNGTSCQKVLSELKKKDRDHLLENLQLMERELVKSR